MIQSLTFPQPHQKKTINANSQGIVFTLLIPAGLTGFIYNVGNNWYSNTYLIWRVDGENVEYKIERETAPINKPRRLDPPIVVKRKIQWIAVNNTSDNLDFEVLCDGVMQRNG